ncbi:Cocaine esterase [Pigmentiphaga humi]|uniref:Cocaine esterase n=1 Tax=Pigmentiphaga humi TaxID=2478468 RepID=A0A3P4B551_9BURK|nr:CocE/NonD family hydrolase [Pigmentiphaga humi]VCU71041.1 Cocaine esterase [Pigmentiphaga humi]
MTSSRPREATLRPTMTVEIPVRDGVRIAAAVYLPAGAAPAPALLAASPYRFDNNSVAPAPIFLWRETGPIDYYLDHGYAFVHMDVRGTGRSGGEYRYMCLKEQQDLYDVIEWIGRQDWCTGKVGGIGQSYYARMQWFMGIQNPPSLACIAPFDGNIDTYRSSAYTGGIFGEYPLHWYNSVARAVNQYPAEGPERLLDWDYTGEVRRHRLYDDFWRERAAAENIDKIEVPVFSIGVWSKVDLHLNGNIVGFQRTRSARKLLVLGSSDVAAAVADYSSEAFHDKYLRRFYDRWLKGIDNGADADAPVTYFVPGANQFRTAQDWPPDGIHYQEYFLAPGPTGSVASLNDGALREAPAGNDVQPTTFDYPNPNWRRGTVGFDSQGRPDRVRYALTFTTEPLADALEVTGPITLELYAGSSNTDTQFIVKLSEQYAQTEAERAEDAQPRSRIVSKGWLRASHRAMDEERSLEHAPWYLHTDPQPLTPGKVEKLVIAIMPTAHQFKKGSRIRLEISNGDSPVTDAPFHHAYAPWQMGTDTIHHDHGHPSRLSLPVMRR